MTISNYLPLSPSQHMIKYRYIPFTHGKPRYRRIDTPQVQQQWQLKAQASPAVAPTTTTTTSAAVPAVVATAMPTISPVSPLVPVKTYSSGSIVPELASSGGSVNGGGSSEPLIQILWHVPRDRDTERPWVRQGRAWEYYVGNSRLLCSSGGWGRNGRIHSQWVSEWVSHSRTGQRRRRVEDSELSIVSERWWLLITSID